MALGCAMKEMRSHFQQHAHETDPQRLQGLYADGREAADMLTFNIVQGVQNERGNFGARSPAGASYAPAPVSCSPTLNPCCSGE